MTNNGFDIGDTLSIRCIGCSKRFDWVVPPGWSHSVPSYHGLTCKRHHRRRIESSETWKCPRPDKHLYRNDKEGREAAAALCMQYNELFSEYRCECGGIHVGKKNYYVKKRVDAKPRK